MNAAISKRIPALITSTVLLLILLVQWLQPGFAERIEASTYDWRMRQAAHFPHPVSTNLAGVFISDDSIETVNDGSLGFSFGLYWPRQLYARVIRELTRQGAKAIAFDILFGERRMDHAPLMVGGRRIGSDEFFAEELARSGRCILGTRNEVIPADLFQTNAAYMGDVSADVDTDGILRRVKAFVDYRIWDRAITEASRMYQLDVRRAELKPDGIHFGGSSPTNLAIAIAADGKFDAAAFRRIYLDEPQTNATPQLHLACQTNRVWNLGLVLAAHELGLDLAKAQVDVVHHRITIRSDAGVTRTIPIDSEDRFYIDWSIGAFDPRLTACGFERLLAQNIMHEMGETNMEPSIFENKLVVIGSHASGNDLTDVVATPIETKTYGVSQHWNVANTLLTDRFIAHPAYALELVLILLMGLAAAWLTWNCRAIWSATLVLACALVYIGVASLLFVRWRLWVPMALPLAGAFLMTHVSMVTYRAIFEQKERRRVRAAFSKMVAPEVVNEVLKSDHLALGGARRKVTVYFADVRGFTELTDTFQLRAEEYVAQRKLGKEAAEIYFDEQAREVLTTVNDYLSTVADVVKKSRGLLDKYIGDCVMAFWGAPVADPQHALSCVRAAIEAQRAIENLNKKRQEENLRREQVNPTRLAQGLPPLNALPLLALGTGINTGIVTVGYMGSEAHIRNYTVFGRDVNLASRLEGVSGRGRIIISKATWEEICLLDPDLAAHCIPLEPVTVKGIRQPVHIFEVPWK